MSLSCEYVYIPKIYIFTVIYNYGSRDLLSQFSFKGIPQRFYSIIRYNTFILIM